MENTDENNLMKSAVKDSVVFVMQRVVITPGNSDKEYYMYIPVDVVRGCEEILPTKEDIKNESRVKNPLPRVFEFQPDRTSPYKDIMDQNGIAYLFPINDVENIDAQYAYAFPTDVTDRPEYEIVKTIKYYKQFMQDLLTRPILQTYDENDGLTKEYFYSDESDSIVNFYPLDPYSLYDIVYKKFDNLHALAIAAQSITDYALHRDSKLLENTESEEKEDTKTASGEHKHMFTDDIYDEVSQTVISQDEQIKKVATAIVKNSLIENPNLKSNVLICGQSGVGKTEIIRCISEYCDIPFAKEDAGEYTPSGYKGKDVLEMIQHLLDSANGNIPAAERGIIYIDEIDKKVCNHGEQGQFESSVINALLKMMEGHVYYIPVGEEGEIPFDTSFVTFIFSGAFSGMFEEKEKEMKEHRPIGFGVQTEEKQSKSKRIYTKQALKDYGVLPEFLGRINSFIPMNDLEEEDLIKIAKTGKKSQLLLQKEHLQKVKNIDLVYDEATIQALAKKAAASGFGARSLNETVEQIIDQANFYIYSKEEYEKLIIDEETVEDPSKFKLIRRKKALKK